MTAQGLAGTGVEGRALSSVLWCLVGCAVCFALLWVRTKTQVARSSLSSRGAVALEWYVPI